MRILVVEEDQLLAEFLRERLLEEHFDVLIANHHDQAATLLASEKFDGMILDLSVDPRSDLGVDSGLHLLRQVRSSETNLMIIALAPASSPADCVKSLEAGADDYLAKPFSSVELIARIRAMFRRRSVPAEAQLTVEDLTLDRIARTVQRGRHRIDLTQKEFELLEFLMERAFQPVTRDVITQYAWESEREKPTNLVAVYINYLRKKVDSGFERPLIRTVRGVGYQIGESRSSA
jgi:DNA-binding response OmpR family regulator